MAEAGRGLYEVLITEAIESRLRELDAQLHARKDGLRIADAADRIAMAYIGSSNLTHSAQVSGLEWNVRVSGARNPDVVDKVGAVFESYWNSGDFLPYDRDEFLAHVDFERNDGPKILLSPFELRPEPFQERLWSKSRWRGSSVTAAICSFLISFLSNQVVI